MALALYFAFTVPILQMLKTNEAKSHIEMGIKIKSHNSGNLEEIQPPNFVSHGRSILLRANPKTEREYLRNKTAGRRELVCYC